MALDHSLEQVGGGEGHLAGVAKRADAFQAGLGELLPIGMVGEQLVQSLGKVLWIVRAVEEAAVGLGQHLRKCPVIGNDYGNS